MAVTKNLWTVFSTDPAQSGNLQSGGNFIFDDLNSNYIGTEPTYDGNPLNHGDVIPWNDSDVTFNVAGSYAFTYNVTTANCSNDNQEMEINLYEVSINETTTTCDYNLVFTNPDDIFDTDVVQLHGVNNSYTVQAKLKYLINRDCGTPETLVESSVQTLSNLIAGPPELTLRYGRSADGRGLPALTNGDFIADIQLYSTAVGVISVDLTSVSPYAGNILTYMNAVRAEIESYLSTTYSYTNGTHYSLSVTTVSASNYALVFGAKNAPASTWVGIDATDAYVTFDDGFSNPYSGDDSGYIAHGGYISTTSVPSPAYSTPCGDMSAAVLVGGVNYDFSEYDSNALGLEINYDTISNNGTASFIYSGTNSRSCSNVPSLEGELFPVCNILEEYEWYDAATGGTLIGDTQTIVPPGSGTYRCEIACGSLICSNTITI